MASRPLPPMFKIEYRCEMPAVMTRVSYKRVVKLGRLVRLGANQLCLLAVDQRDRCRRTDGRTPDRYIDPVPVPHTLRATFGPRTWNRLPRPSDHQNCRSVHSSASVDFFSSVQFLCRDVCTRLNAQFTTPAGHDKTVLSASCQTV